MVAQTTIGLLDGVDVLLPILDGLILAKQIHLRPKDLETFGCRTRCEWMARHVR